MFPLAFGHVQDRHDRPSVDLHGDLPVSPGYPRLHIGEYDLRSLREEFIVLRVFEGKRQDAEIAEIGLVDAGKALNDLRADTQKPRRKRRVFAARSLAVVLAAP